ncbi:hypothetical protein GCM10012275_64100 [Longimycelium tulufanense]|uniref:Sporulation protein n=1 Tax=Longimycelium tulufanense TaxID=907463 RepID=A0A8J3CF17_9PSEU|nr:hypothetical protein [Longimycelium tulufanense]GGM84569.1 hypothetical protein GCM10012275_64100 [Longimycelium tulufanense]
MSTQREPNRLLAAVMDEARLSNKGLARRVCDEASRAGHKIAADHVAVRRWLDGVRPRDRTARWIAAALSAKLGRVVSLAEIGFGEIQAAADVDVLDEGTQYHEQPERSVDLLDKLTSADLTDSSPVMTSKWVPTTAPGVITGYLFSGRLASDEERPPTQSGVSVASRIRATIRHLTDLDFQFGGGHTRTMLLHYWKSEVVPALRQRHPEPIRREIFRAAADAAEVLGWSAYDAGRHRAAQCYFVQGLRLAREADDPLMAGQILSNLSHQSNYVGEFSDALQYARAAQSATSRKASATVRAMFLAMEARALASMGDTRGCITILHQAEQEFEKRNPDSDPDWISYFDALELAGEASHCFRDLGKPRETQLFVAQAIDPVRTPPRTRAFIGMVSAAGALTARSLKESIALATDAVKMAEGLQSNRYLRYVADFHNSLTAGYAVHPAVQQFTSFIREKHPGLILLDRD